MKKQTLTEEFKRMQMLAGLINENQANEELTKEEKIFVFKEIVQAMEKFRNSSRNILFSGAFDDDKKDYFLSLMLQLSEMAKAYINKINSQTELNEEVSNDVEKYLKHHFEVYLEGGDTFEEEPGETHTFTMGHDEFGNSEYYDDANVFEKAVEQLKDSPFVLDYSKEGYEGITFNSDGIDITVSFVV